MKHTPGPWKANGPSPGNIKGFDDGGDYAIISGGIIAEAFHRIDDNTFVDAEANARLIAAAPELLATLKFALAEISDMTTDAFSKGADKEARDRMKQAIAKAEGDA